MAGEWHCSKCGKILNVLDIHWASDVVGHVNCACGASYLIEGRKMTDNETVYYISDSNTDRKTKEAQDNVERRFRG